MISFAKVLSVGLGDLVSARNAALRMAGFEVVAAVTLEDVFEQCVSGNFDVAIVGHGFSLKERAEFVRCFRGVLRLPVILIAEGRFLVSLQADSHLDVSAPPEDLVCAIQQLLGDKGRSAVAV